MHTDFKLTIDRSSQVYLGNPPIKVIIDNSIRLSIENGHTETVNLPITDQTIELSLKAHLD